MKIDLSPREVSILVECCCRAPACVEMQARELIHKLKFSHLELEPFRRVPQNRRQGPLNRLGCDNGVGVDLGDIKKVRRLATHRNAK